MVIIYYTRLQVYCYSLLLSTAMSSRSPTCTLTDLTCTLLAFTQEASVAHAEAVLCI